MPYAIVIEVDTDHIQHVESDVRKGYTEASFLESLYRGDSTAYGVHLVHIHEDGCLGRPDYVHALWGIEVEAFAEEGTYFDPEKIQEPYLREVAYDLLTEAAKA